MTIATSDRLDDGLQPIGMERMNGAVHHDELPDSAEQPFQDISPSCFPEPVREYLRQSAKSIDVPLAAIAGPFLTGLAGTIGTSRLVKIKRQWQEPIVLWAAVIAPDGFKKTSCGKAALLPLEVVETELFHDWKDRDAERQAGEARYRQAMKKWEADPHGDPPAAPASDLPTSLIVKDATVEAVRKEFEGSPHGLVWWRGELAGIVGGIGQYKHTKDGDLSFLLETYDAGPDRCIRVSGPRGGVRTDHAAVSLTGFIQPSAYLDLFSETLQSRGFAGRFLTTYPPSKPPRWIDADIDEEVERSAVELARAMTHASLDSMRSNGPIEMTLSADALDLFKSATQELNMAAWNEPDSRTSSFLRKTPGILARLSGLYQMVRFHANENGAGAREIDRESVVLAMMTARWFGQEARRAFALLTQQFASDSTGESVRAFVERRGGSASKTEIRQFIRRFRDDPDGAERAMQELVDSGEYEWQEPTGLPGRPARRIVRVDMENVT